MSTEFRRHTLATASTLHVLPEKDVRHATVTAAQLTAMASLLRFAREVSNRG